MERRRPTPAGDVAARREAGGDRDAPAPRSALEDDHAELERRLDLAMEASSAGAWSWNSRTNRSTWDDRYHVMYGFAADEPRSYEAWLARVHPGDRPRVVARLDAMRRTPGDDDWSIEFRAICPGLGVRWMHGLGRALRDSAGRIVSMTGINLDVTARKQAEQRLRESEEQFRLFFDSAPAAVAMFDRDMRYLAVSRRWLGCFDLPDDVIGRCHYDVFPNLPERWRQTNDRCLAGATESAEEDRFERADGAVQWLKWQVLPWCTALGDVGGIIILCEDITESRRWIARQQVLIDELQHRTRNVLSVVQAIAQQTMQSTDSVDSFMARFGRRLAALSRVQGLLSRSDLEPITIGTLVRMEIDALGAEAAVARARVEGPDVRLRKRDVQTLALAIHELATNAWKHGALSARGGRLVVSWRVGQDAAARAVLALEWVESGLAGRLDPDDAQPGGYGRTLVERALPYALSAQSSFEVGDRDFRCVIRLPLDAAQGAEVREE